MREIAFKVKKDSEFYKGYFEAEAEKKKFWELAKEFFKKYELENKKFCLTNRLALYLSQELAEKLSTQLKKDRDYNGMYHFKKNSAIQKAWTNEVCSQVDFKKLDYTFFWYLGYIHSGQYCLWHENNEIYGYLSNKYDEDVTIPKFAIPIKISEYYAAKESFEGEDE